MEITTEALNKVEKWANSEISIYRISKEIGVTWPTVRNWLKGKHKISYELSKKIMETEI